MAGGGDLLPNATQEQRLATTFNRLHLQNEEGGIVEEEYRVAYNVDRVNTFGTAFLGMTFECSRCHDHKYDPISQKEFYQFFAFFQNIDESGQSVYFGDIMPVPTLLLSTPDQETKLKDLNARIQAGEGRLKQLTEASRPSFADWQSRGWPSLRKSPGPWLGSPSTEWFPMPFQARWERIGRSPSRVPNLSRDVSERRCS